MPSMNKNVTTSYKQPYMIRFIWIVKNFSSSLINLFSLNLSSFYKVYLNLNECIKEFVSFQATMRQFRPKHTVQIRPSPELMSWSPDMLQAANKIDVSQIVNINVFYWLNCCSNSNCTDLQLGVVFEILN